MKKNKFFLIAACIFILMLFTGSVMASDDISNDNTIQINLENTNTDIESISQTFVDDGSAGNQMENPTIQNLINSANAGDTIIINGTDYVHCHFVVDKKLTIISTVGTKMSPCPSNLQGSNGIGIFYISPEASGTVLSGFTLVNNEFKTGTVNPYCIFVNGANNVEIANCTIEETTNGPGIFANNTDNVKILDCTVKESEKGIYLENCKNALISHDTIANNYGAGIYVGAGSQNLNVSWSIIEANNYYGFYLGSATNTVIYANVISANRDDPVVERAKKGVGIYVDTPATNLQILGNFIEENGQYGIFDSYKFDNIVDQYVQIINNNYFVHHTQRAVFHAANPQNDTGIVYVWSNYYSNELFCGGTSYEPGVLISNHQRDLVMSPITEVKNGVYSVSFVRKDTGEVATLLNSINITFYLNKKTTYPYPEAGDIYQIIHIENGTAIADFRNATFLESGNNITTVGPGYGVITYKDAGPLPSQLFNIPNDHIPGNGVETAISGNSLTKYYGNNASFVVTLLADGTPLANQTVCIVLNGETYRRKTNDAGEGTLKINLRAGAYNIQLFYEGNDEYRASSANDTITVKSTVIGEDLTKYFRNGSQYITQFVDSNGNPLKNTPVRFNINGVYYNRITNASGLAKVNINLNIGEYIVTAENLANNEMYSNLITVLPIITENHDLTLYYKNGSKYSVQVLDGQGNPATDQSVVFNINGVFYDRVSKDDGMAWLTINLKPGKYIVTAIYGGFMASNMVEVLPILKAENLEMFYANMVPFTASPLDANGNPVAGAVVKFNFYGQIYEIKSNSQGNAEVSLDLAPGKYIITSEYNGCYISNEITVSTDKGQTKIINDNPSLIYVSSEGYNITLMDQFNHGLPNYNIEFNIENLDIPTYDYHYKTNTNANGMYSFKMQLVAGTYRFTVTFNGTESFYPSSLEKTVSVLPGTVVGEATNDELQNIIDSASSNDIIQLTAENYNDVSLVISKPVVLTSPVNSTLNGCENAKVITVNVDGATISGLTIIANNASAINVKGNDNTIENCIIKNDLDEKLIDDYNSGTITMPGNGIEIENCGSNNIAENEIKNFLNGIYLENANGNMIMQNTITQNNYGIEFGYDVKNTRIESNKIVDNIGLITMDVVEGPLGYGISIRHSGVNVTILDNYIDNNYEGIFIDAKNCTGIAITGNSISNNTIEGITFNENYTYAQNAVQPIVENNAIYNNAKGPSMIVLGEVSANPAGIYGPGEWNSSQKLHLGANWYGTNTYTTWVNGSATGAGTICPRINTTLITCNVTTLEPGKYEVKFYNNGVLATQLPDFTIYFTLNFKTDNAVQTVVNVHEGIGTFEFAPAYYEKTGNKIEASSGSLFDINRKFQVIYEYDIPDSEIPK